MTITHSPAMLPLALAMTLAMLAPLPSLAAVQPSDEQPGASTVPQVESAFSPDAHAEALVLKVINTATGSLRVAAYSFSSPTILQALLDARQRGVDIRVVVDHRRNQKKNNLAALARLAGAGIAVRTVAVYAMHHDKYIIADERTLQNGSFNYTRDAAEANSENVVVYWNNAPLAQAFMRHWESRWRQGVAWQAQR